MSGAACASVSLQCRIMRLTLRPLKWKRFQLVGKTFTLLGSIRPIFRHLNSGKPNISRIFFISTFAYAEKRQTAQTAKLLA